jgi:hypothetical protein
MKKEIDEIITVPEWEIINTTSLGVPSQCLPASSTFSTPFLPCGNVEQHSWTALAIGLVNTEISSAIKLDDIVRTKVRDIAVCPSLCAKFIPFRQEQIDVVVLLNFIICNEVVEEIYIDLYHISRLLSKPGNLLFCRFRI